MNKTYVAAKRSETPEKPMPEVSDTPCSEEGIEQNKLLPIQMYFCEGEIFYFAEGGNSAT